MESRINRLLIRHGWSKTQFSQLSEDEQDYWIAWEYHEEQEEHQRQIALEERISSMYEASDSDRVKASADGKSINSDVFSSHVLLELLRLIGRQKSNRNL